MQVGKLLLHYLLKTDSQSNQVELRVNLYLLLATISRMYQAITGLLAMYYYTKEHRPANLRWGNWVRFENGAIFEILLFNGNSIIYVIKLVEIGAIFSLFLTLKPDFGWGNCLSLTLNEWQLAGLQNRTLSNCHGLTGCFCNSPLCKHAFCPV